VLATGSVYLVGDLLGRLQRPAAPADRWSAEG